MTEIVRREGWSKGINNKANWRRMPDGTTRDLVNLDPLPGGVLALRAGYEKVYAGTDVRGALSVGRYVLIADGTQLVMYDRLQDTAQVLATIAGSGRFVGDVLNDELFFCTENQTLRFKDGSLRAWGVPTVTAQPVPTATAGALAAGSYQWAVVFRDAHGDEGGTARAGVTQVPAGGALQFTLPTPPAGGSAHLYVGAVNSANLYLQYSGSGPYVVNSVRDDTAELGTMHMRSPTVGSQVVALNSILTIVEGKTLWMTTPFRPHLVSPARGFYQYGADIGMVVAGDGGLFVSADKTYFLRAVETDSPEQAAVFEFPALAGSGVVLPDGRAAWMTQYGLAISDGRGGAALVSQDNFAPQLATDGSSGIIERNGNQLVVTTVRGVKGANPMTAGDYYEAEIITP